MPVRIAVIDREVCIHKKCGYVCAKVCPPNRMGEECIVVEENGIFPVISEILCIGCGLCAKKCPVQCIKIINLAEELENPIFQYSVNSFRLYGLPLPKDGAVSLVGKNGIGKTTSIQLLAGHIMPNFASFGKKLGRDELLSKMPIELKRYFESLSSDVSISSKPQHINRIRDVFKGTVNALLKTSNAEKNRIKEGILLFGLNNIVTRDISQLSGGELQKAAICTAWLKEASIYYFDEVTNYLDIEERLKVAVILKELAEKKQVLLAEHDLTILDYVSNYVYLFYGEENTYGIVSHIKNVRVGINEYLNGFLKDENIRFRTYEIKFSGHSESEVKNPVLLQYSELNKKFKNGFKFSSDSGEIRKGEILGLVGKNALGKSLFVKLLAGIEKPDSGEPVKLKISYKPQYITAEDITVESLFAAQPINGSIFDEARRRLSVGSLMEKKLTELSGGELQRVALVLAISRDADIYLFDEPSAFLDIEHFYEK